MIKKRVIATFFIVSLVMILYSQFAYSICPKPDYKPYELRNHLDEIVYDFLVDPESSPYYSDTPPHTQELLDLINFYRSEKERLRITDCEVVGSKSNLVVSEIMAKTIPTVAECGDGADNDRDGKFDMYDQGCTDRFDNKEANCGDKVCQVSESCNSCASDCGSCGCIEMEGIIDSSMGTQCGDENFDLRADINKNGYINFHDKNQFRAEKTRSSCDSMLDDTRDPCIQQSLQCEGKGDVLIDTSISLADASLIYSYPLSRGGSRFLDEVQYYNADVDNDGTVTYQDAELIENYALTGEGRFPACKEHSIIQSIDVTSGGTLAHSGGFPPPEFEIFVAVSDVDFEIFGEVVSESEEIVKTFQLTKDELNFDLPDQDVFVGKLVMDNVAHGTYTIKVRAETPQGFFDVDEVTIELLENLCKELIPGHNNAAADRLNLVFAGINYLDGGQIPGVGPVTGVDLVTMVGEEFVDALFTFEPYNGQKQKFNFWYVDEIGFTVDKPASGEPRDGLRVGRTLTRECGVQNIYAYHLYNNNFRSSAKPGPGGYVFWSVPFSTIRNEFGLHSKIATGVHETGHLIGLLGDEYITFTTSVGTISNWLFFKGPNSFRDSQDFSQDGDTTVAECLQDTHWKEMIGNGCGQEGIVDCFESIEPVRCKENMQCWDEVSCFEGAWYKYDIFRSTYNSIMRASSLDYSFGPVGEFYTQEQLDRYSGEVE
jgi:hypothetical protein